MSTTLTLDETGNLLIPSELLQGRRFSSGAPVEVEQTSDGLLVRPARVSERGRLVRNEHGQLVIASGVPISDEEVIAAIASERK